jgi:hypothetical protein
LFLPPAYIAGVFDSEGSFSIVKKRRNGARKGYEYSVLLQITWKEIPDTVRTLEDLKRAYGGSVICGIEKSGYSKRTRYIRYRIGARQARRLIEDTLPYLRIKRRQAQICLLAASIISRHHRGRWNPRPVEEWARLGRLQSEIRVLNRKNGKGRRW